VTVPQSIIFELVVNLDTAKGRCSLFMDISAGRATGRAKREQNCKMTCKTVRVLCDSVLAKRLKSLVADAV
jgi:hypothetical protein